MTNHAESNKNGADQSKGSESLILQANKIKGSASLIPFGTDNYVMLDQNKRSSGRTISRDRLLQSKGSE